MYTTSKALKDQINALAVQISDQSAGKIRFEEYIALPYYGHIILRFDLNGEVSLAQLDEYEAQISDIVGDAFLIDFMGRVYRKVGIRLENFPELFLKCRGQYRAEPVPASVHAEQIREDAAYLLRLCGLSEQLPVWEIQPEEEIELLTLGDGYVDFGLHQKEGLTIHAAQVNQKECEGLLKACLYAKRSRISLARALLR